MELKNGYSIGEAAKALDIPASTIRYYEKNGLLPHIGRTEGGIRSFTDADLDLLRLIGHLKMSGMSLQEIGEFVRLSELGDESIEDRRALVHGRREKILEQIEDLNRTLRFIEYKCWFYDTAAAAGTCEVPRKMPKEEMPPELLAILEECQIQGH